MIAGEGVVGGEHDAVALNVVATGGANHHHFARTSLEQDNLEKNKMGNVNYETWSFGRIQYLLNDLKKM